MFTSWGISNWVMWKASQETKFPASLPSRISWQSTQGEGMRFDDMINDLANSFSLGSPGSFHAQILGAKDRSPGHPTWTQQLSLVVKLRWKLKITNSEKYHRSWIVVQPSIGICWKLSLRSFVRLVTPCTSRAYRVTLLLRNSRRLRLQHPFFQSCT